MDLTKQIMKQAMNFYGLDKQLIKLQEECGELVTAVSKYQLGLVPFKKVLEEIADVSVLIQQHKNYGRDGEIIETIEGQKLIRLLNRMHDEQSQRLKDER